MPLVHVVLVSFHDHVPPERREELRTKQNALGERCGGRDAGILAWRSDYNLDQRKNYHLMQFSVFRDRDAFERFRVHSAHTELGAEMRELADWVVGDLEADMPAI